ncbi:N,N-dimethylformamidase beta subunit family domain-containing protein [Streptomyces sp. M19]
MRQTVERARDSGTSLVFLSANTMYWQVELAPRRPARSSC